MTDVYLSLGSNVGDRETYLKQALSQLSELPQTSLVSVSSIYQTPAWGKTDQAAFLNLCCQLETDLEPQALLRYCQVIEKNQGRKRHEHWGPRTLDIDILLYGQDLINLPDLKVPHPYMTERAFVLVPLAEIAAEVAHPVKEEKIGYLLKQVDGEGIERFS